MYRITPPDGGAICYVIKDRFFHFPRKIIKNSGERNKVDNTIEAFVFIELLLVIAFIESYYVIKRLLEREGTLTYKLLLRCIIIITSDFRAELTIELSLTINNSFFFFNLKELYVLNLSIFLSQIKIN